jgi:hypothetical protein
MTLRGIGHTSFAAANARDPASRRRAPAFDSSQTVSHTVWESFVRSAHIMTQVGANWNQITVELNAWLKFGMELRSLARERDVEPQATR